MEVKANVEFDEKALYEEFKNECKSKKYRCSNTCSTWDFEDRDCDIFGESHPTYSHCPRAYAHWKEMKEKER